MFPEADHSDQRPWHPWVTADPDLLSVSAMVADALADPDLRSRHVYLPGSQFRHGYCPAPENVWVLEDRPDSLFEDVVAHVRAHAVPEARSVIDGANAALADIARALDDPAAAGFSPAEVPLLEADEAALKELVKHARTALKHVAQARNGSRVLKTVLNDSLPRIAAPDGFSFRTSPIPGLPFTNGILYPSGHLNPDRGGPVTFRPYGPEDRVWEGRTIERTFDTDKARTQAEARRRLTGRIQRPFGWEWLIRGFLGLPRPETPPPPLTADDLTDFLHWWEGAPVEDPETGEMVMLSAAQDILGDPPDAELEALRWFDRLLAGSLFVSDEAPFKKLPFIYGPSNTGKSTLFNVVQQLIGRLYGSVTPSAVLAGRTLKDVPQLLASVMGRRFITPASEVPARAEWRSEVVKAFVGNDTLLAERKYEQPVEFRPQGALWVAGNHYLTHEDRDDSMTNRIVYLTFCQPSGRRLTPAEVSRLVAAEADAVLWWLAEIHSQMQAEATTSTRIPLRVTHYDPDMATRTDPNVNYWSDVAYAYPPTMVPDIDTITTETDPWSLLWEECYEVTGQPEDWTSNADLYAVYRQWAVQQEGIGLSNVLQRAAFTQRVLKGRPGVSSKRRPGSGERGSSGIALTPTGKSLLADARMA